MTAICILAYLLAVACILALNAANHWGGQDRGDE